MGKGRRTAEAQAVAALFDALIARRRTEAQRARTEALAQLSAMRQALAQKVQQRRRPT